MLRKRRNVMPAKTSGHNSYGKKGKDRSFLDNWRPITLVNVEAKIMSKSIATRIKDVLPNIIHHNQTGLIEDRYIGDTVRSIFDIMDLTSRRPLIVWNVIFFKNV